MPVGYTERGVAITKGMIAASTVVEVFKYVAIVIVMLVLIGEISQYFNDDTTNVLQESYDMIQGVSSNSVLNLRGEIAPGHALLFFNEDKNISLTGPAQSDMDVTSFKYPESECSGSMCICYCGQVRLQGEQASCPTTSIECKSLSQEKVAESTELHELYPGNTDNQRYFEAQGFESCYQLQSSNIRDYRFMDGVVLYNPPTKPLYDPSLADTAGEVCQQNTNRGVLGYKYDLFSASIYQLTFNIEDNIVSLGQRKAEDDDRQPGQTI